jgi:hypothetical protein
VLPPVAMMTGIFRRASRNPSLYLLLYRAVFEKKATIPCSCRSRYSIAFGFKWLEHHACSGRVVRLSCCSVRGKPSVSLSLVFDVLTEM